MKTTLISRIGLCFLASFFLLLVTGWVHLPRQKKHSLNELYPLYPTVAIYRYIIVQPTTPLRHFLPKDKRDWTLSYFLKHPKDLSIGWYLLENHFYRGGVPEAKSFLSSLFDYGYKLHSGEIRFDACLLSEFLPPTDLFDLRPKYGPADMDIKDYYEFINEASPSQGYSLLEASYFRSGYVEMKWILSRFSNDSYFDTSAAMCCVAYLDTKRRPFPGFKPDPLSDRYLTLSEEITLLKKAMKLDPTNFYSCYILMRTYLIRKDYSQALKYAEKGKNMYAKLNLPRQNDLWLNFCNEVSFCKRELGLK